MAKVEHDKVTIEPRDHGGGLDAALQHFGGQRLDWIDLSTGINPVAFDLPKLSRGAWTDLPDTKAENALTEAARQFWGVPAEAGILAAPGASVLIAQLPQLWPTGRVCIPQPTYNEHSAAFKRHGWDVVAAGTADAQVVVHPNNPDGQCWHNRALPVSDADFTVLDESFCDVQPELSLTDMTTRPNTLVLKSFGKFWGLAGMRLGFAIGDRALLADLKERLGPWPVAGPTLEIGAAALSNIDWARQTRSRLEQDRSRLDDLMTRAGAEVIGGTSLFGLYRVDDSIAWQNRLARQRIWSRVFPYAPTWLRLGMPHPDHWARVEAALT